MDGDGTTRKATAAFLFCDLVGSTQATVAVGEDAGDRLRWRCFSVLRTAVVATNGREVKTTGDGLLVWFASAVAALDCAVAMQQGMERCRHSPDGGVLGLRVGVAVGDAVNEGEDWFGLPLVEASRLCSHAQEGQILATSVVAAVAGRRGQHRFVPVGDLELKGLDETVPTIDVSWRPVARTPPLPGPLTRGQSSHFVRREEEMSRLLSIHETVTAGESALVLLSGEPGVGKTSIASEVAAWVHERGGIVLYGRCDEELAIAYQPFREAIQGWFETSEWDEVEETLTRWPQLGRIAGPFAERAAVSLPPSGDQAGERTLLFGAVEAWLRGLAQQAPLVLVIDDLHWATGPTLQLLRHLSHQRWCPLHIIATFRDTDVAMDHEFTEMLAEVHRQENVHRIILRGFDRDGVVAYMEARAGYELPPMGRELADRIHRETGGNPFFVGEILRHLAETGTLTNRDGRWDIITLPARLELPDGVRAVIARRLARLSASANQALRVAAILGPTFPFAVLAGVPLSGSASALLDALDEACAAGVLEEAGDADYTFSHALVRKTIYSSLSSARRRALHREIASAIEALPTPLADQHFVLAHHLCEGAGPGDGARAATYALVAGREALVHGAYQSALDQFNRGLDVLTRYGPPDPALESDLYLGLAEGCYRTADYQARGEAACAAARAARIANSPERLAWAAFWNARFGIVGTLEPGMVALCEEALAALPPGPSGLRSRVMSMLASCRVLAGEGMSADPLAVASVAMARECGDDLALAHALDARISALAGGPHIGRRHAVADELIAVTTACNDITQLGNSHRLLASVCLTEGDRSAFDDSFRRMSEMAEHQGDGFLRAIAAQWRATVALLDGDFDAVEGPAGEAVELSGDDPNFANAWGAQVLHLRREQGRVAELLSLLESKVEENPTIVGFRAFLTSIYAELGEHSKSRYNLTEILGGPIPNDWIRTACLTYCAEAAATIGAADVADFLDEELAPWTGQMVVVATGTHCPGAVDRFRAMISALRGEWDEAAARFDAALSIETRMRTGPNLARTHLWYARMLKKRGSLAEAVAHARTSAELAKRFGMTGVLTDARALA